MYRQGPLDGPASVLWAVLWTWLVGSGLFMLAGVCLAGRNLCLAWSEGRMQQRSTARHHGPACVL